MFRRKHQIMKLYRFSPIKDIGSFVKSVKYIATQTTKLCEKTIGKTLQINYLTIFSHYQEEYENLIKLLQSLGSSRPTNNGIRFELNEPIEVVGQKIKSIRIRKPDPYRTHVGCNDFAVVNYQEFKEKYQKPENKNLRLLVRQEYEMIEFFHPDFDVLAYVVSKSF